MPTFSDVKMPQIVTVVFSPIAVSQLKRPLCSRSWTSAESTRLFDRIPGSDAISDFSRTHWRHCKYVLPLCQQQLPFCMEAALCCAFNWFRLLLSTLAKMERSIFKNYVISRHDYQPNTTVIQSLCNGFALGKVESKSKIERKKFCMHLEMCRIEWYRPMPTGEEFEGYIDFRDVREIRLNINLLTVLYGKKFCLNKLSCKGKFNKMDFKTYIQLVYALLYL